MTMPKIPELNDPAITDDMLLKSEGIVEQMEEVIMSWEKHIQKVSISIFFLFSYVRCLMIFLQFSDIMCRTRCTIIVGLLSNCECK